ncbi:MAG: hypothetical protein JW786_07790 [Desulfobacterales bacterium]|nr:hypothetical protein [Desulfobacterales bacterium]
MVPKIFWPPFKGGRGGIGNGWFAPLRDPQGLSAPQTASRKGGLKASSVRP